MKKKKMRKKIKRLVKACNELDTAWAKGKKTISNETIKTLLEYCW